MAVSVEADEACCSVLPVNPPRCTLLHRPRLAGLCRADCVVVDARAATLRLRLEGVAQFEIAIGRALRHDLRYFGDVVPKHVASRRDEKPVNLRSRKCECMPIPVPKTSLILRVSCPVRGASRGDPEVGQSESWPEGQPEGRCGARGHASQAWTRGALGSRPGPL
jgi:hypothetical protein